MLSTAYVPGSPNWIDLGTPDTAASSDFYAAAFGWGYQSAGPEGGGYGFFTQDGKMVAGIGPLTEEGAGAAWTVYFHSPDADATARAVERAGGTVRFGATDVFSFGRMAGFTDPTGAEFAVWQPFETGGLEVVGVPVSLTWTELYTTDAGAARDFYRAVFAWEAEDMDMGPGMTYTVVRPEGTDPDAAHGGLMRLPQEHVDAGATSEWHPYFEVADCDAVADAATAAGATALVPPVDAEGIGRLARFTDPSGAPFAVIKGATS
ncbi:VOC family protein [Streptomyces albiaxialis]|uniref:VOC family protein n=1 Tax=Streptomyces albiaxialis TaxID=329523 RepID=A0ABN2WWV1_9ACTN